MRVCDGSYTRQTRHFAQAGAGREHPGVHQDRSLLPIIGPAPETARTDYATADEYLAERAQRNTGVVERVSARQDNGRNRCCRIPAEAVSAELSAYQWAVGTGYRTPVSYLIQDGTLNGSGTATFSGVVPAEVDTAYFLFVSGQFSGVLDVPEQVPEPSALGLAGAAPIFGLAVTQRRRATQILRVRSSH